MLALYRRHRLKCKAHHAHNTRTSEYDERKKGWKRCECPIFASGTIGTTAKRHNTQQWEWEPAHAAALAMEQASAWTAPAPTPEPPKEQQQRTTLADAIAVFLVNRESSNIAKPTLRKYRTFTKQLTAFADTRGYVMIDQFRSSDIDLFYSSIKLGPRTKANRLGTLRSFFRFALNREWIAKTPISPDLKAPTGASRVANKVPFTDEELTRIIDACDRMQPVHWANWQGEGTWTGEDLKDFIWTMIYTGLRISDTALFHMDRLRGNEVFLRAKKNGGEVFAYLPDWLCERLKGRAAKRGNRPFIVGRSDKLETVTDMWRRKLNFIFALAGKFDEVPTAHKFRHTFARVLLQRGVPVPDVAELMGDTEAVIRKFYARWIPERQARLTRILQDAFDDRPKPKIVAMPNR